MTSCAYDSDSFPCGRNPDSRSAGITMLCLARSRAYMQPLLFLPAACLPAPRNQAARGHEYDP